MSSNRKRIAIHLAKQNFRCFYCERFVRANDSGETYTTPDTATIDHMVPRSRGGTNAEHNVVVACAECNKRKSDRLAIGFLLQKIKQRKVFA